MSKKEKKVDTKNEIKSNIGLVIAERLNVRETPELNANIIAELKKNQKVEVLGIEKDFYKLSNGYVVKKYINI